MQFDVIIAGICFRFISFPENIFGNFWKWKLDPWKNNSVSRSDLNFIIEIRYDRTEKLLPSVLPVLYAKQAGFFEQRIYLNDTKGLFWDFIRIAEDKVYLRFSVNKDWDSINLLGDLTHTRGYTAFENLAQMMPGVLLKHDLLTFHAALLEYEEQAFAVCAPSGTGKTTHARLWRDHKNALILNGDRAVIGREGKVWTAYGTPWSGTSGEQINRRASLKALVVLKRSEENFVVKLSGIQAFGAVFPHLQFPVWNRKLSETAIDLLNALLNDVPVYCLSCRPDTDAVEVLYQKLYKG